MGVWGSGNFDNDAAADYLDGLLGQMFEQVEATAVDEWAMAPDEEAGARMMCNIELLGLVGRHIRLVPMDAAVVERWKQKYLVVWDGCIDRLQPVPGFKGERRKVIVDTFDRLIELCREREAT